MEIKNIHHTLNQLGVSPKIYGYDYITSAVRHLLAKPRMKVGQLYNVVADEYDSTYSRVERSIRNACQMSATRGDVNLIDRIFGYNINGRRGYVSNGDFLFGIANYIREEYTNV